MGGTVATDGDESDRTVDAVRSLRDAEDGVDAYQRVNSAGARSVACTPHLLFPKFFGYSSLCNGNPKIATQHTQRFSTFGSLIHKAACFLSTQSGVVRVES